MSRLCLSADAPLALLQHQRAPEAVMGRNTLLSSEEAAERLCPGTKGGDDAVSLRHC